MSYGDGDLHKEVDRLRREADELREGYDVLTRKLASAERAIADLQSGYADAARELKLANGFGCDFHVEHARELGCEVRV